VKILHLLYESKGDYFGIGGVGIRAYEIYKYLKDRHNITLLCKKYPGAKDGEIEGLRHIFVGTESKSLTKTLLSYAYHATRFVKKYSNNFDIIVEEFSPAIPTFLHIFTKKPLILQVQGYTGGFYFRKYNLAYASFLYVLEHLRPMFYDNFIFINEQTIKRLLPKELSPSPSPPPLEGGGWGRGHLTGINVSFGKRKNIKIISNGVSPELLTISPTESDYILYLGRIDIHHKGLDILLKAYKEFCKTFASIRLVIAGDGRDRDRFLALLYKLPQGIQQNIELKGWVDGKRKVHLLKDALMVVLPSRYETQGIVALEAMAFGKPVIVSDIPELSYVIKNKAGISFKTEDSISLAQSMKDLLISNERKEMGQRGRQWVKDFTWNKIALKFESFLSEVLER
jgi:glycosyltransferase involved in cell wall biosynthesis